MTPTTKPSSNWLALQKTLVRHGHPRKRRKNARGESSVSLSGETSAFPRGTSSPPPKRDEPGSHNQDIDLETSEVKNGESIAALRRMVLGKVAYETSPGKYLALDCEMVGVGIEGSESSLARVSIVNYTGTVILDVFVRQREKVVDYRTQWSGVRSTDLVGSAKTFKEVQQTVADLIKDRILVGHAIYNDLKALLLSHPSPQIRDTQSLAYKHRIVKSRRPALRVLVKQELGIVIQGGEHSSVTDARATMALFRLYKKQWESHFRLSYTLAHSQSKNEVDDDCAGRATILSRSSPSLAYGKKRGHSESFKSDDVDVDEVTEALSPSSRTSPSLSRAQHISTLSTRHKQRRSELSTRSTNRTRPSSGISTVVRRPGLAKEVLRRGTQTRNGGGASSVVVNSPKGVGKTGKIKEKWWKSLGGSKKGSIKL
ncbi:ribonuclease H-like domain-containing protein [Boletus edulis BED1]|uniref:RNA exonuclease 4 n=1 Tax=Boletus edulis BED1 TaxID=1328754 RepID=A0AAD4BMM8_BOLED|nr:ribonuclease H-like domain-containing protein [Boletus edulis BED1]